MTSWGGRIGRLVVTHKDRLLRFGAEELTQDVLVILTVLSAWLDGIRSRKNQKLLDDVKQAVEEVLS